MARTYQLMDGVLPNISLIASAGAAVRIGGFGHSRSSPGSNLPAASLRIPESYTLKLVGTSHDNAATQLQALITMLRKAKQKHTTHWQTTPVYIQSQMTNETNARYAVVYDCPELGLPDLYGEPFTSANVIADFGLTIVRGVWQSAVPGTLPSALTLTATDGPADPTMVHVSNFRDDTALTHLYNYDHSVTTFSANQYDQTGITLWSVSASTPAADDIVYIGSTTAAWRHFVINLATAGAFTANVKAEYWDGDSWEELTIGTEFTLYPTGNEDEIFKSTGDWVLNVAPPDDWAANAINAVTAHWIRLYLTTVTVWTTTPVSHGTNAPYIQKNPFIEFASTILKGDIPPIAQLRLFSPYGAGTSPCLGACSRIIIGSKSRNLTKFDAYINLGNVDNDGDWATSYSADASSVADPVAPGGKHAACDFSNSSLMVSRVILTGTALLDDFVGQYRVFVRVQQVGGGDGDLKIKLRTSVGSVADEFPKIDLPQEGIALKTQDAGWELIDLGVLQIPFGELTAADTSTTDLIFEVMAERLTGTSTIEFADMILLPIDEWSTVLQDPVSSPTLGSSALRGDTVLDLDAGVLMDRTIKYYRSGATLYAAENWYRSGEPPKLEPGRQTRLYFLLMHYPVDWGIGPFLAPLGMHLAIEMRGRMIYLTLRGSD